MRTRTVWITQRIVFVALCLTAALGWNRSASGDEVDVALRTLSQVGPNGAGSAEARKSCDQLSQSGIEILPRLLVAMDTPNNIAANWYRTVYEEVVQREQKRPEPQFPVPVLKEFIGNARRQGKARRLVLTLLEKLDAEFVAEFLPRALDDPEFRREAVEAALKKGDASLEAGQTDAAKDEFQRAFSSARDSDQISAAAGKLLPLGVKASVVEKMGFLVDWYLIGPFDAPEFTGFEKVFPPEEKIELAAEYAGQGDKPIGWKRHFNPDGMGQLNLVQVIAPAKEAVGYAYTEVISPRDQTVQVRCGADDNCSVWVNGEKVFGRNQWLNGTRLDRFVAPVKLLRGKNTVLVKICQGPQHKDPEVFNAWSLQIRLCDAEGAGLGLKSALPKE